MKHLFNINEYFRIGKASICKVIVLICACCVTFYLSSQIVNETAAVFTDQEQSTTVITAALVFPDTVEKLEGNAKKLSQEMIDTYTRATETLPSDLTLQEAKNEREKLQTMQTKLTKNMQDFKAILADLQSYYERAMNNKSELEYVQSGYQSVKELYEKTGKKIDFQQITQKLSVLKERISKLTAELASKNNPEDLPESPLTKSNSEKNQPDKESPSKDQAASTDDDQRKQNPVTEQESPAKAANKQEVIKEGGNESEKTIKDS